ncbi:MAG TPA: EthD family reductase [Burkholderiales bacterium]
MIKTITLLTRRPEISHEEFLRHWHEEHAALAHAVPGLRRYVQNVIVQEPSRPDIPDHDIAVDGIAELWYDDIESWKAAHASPQGKALTDDGATFIGRVKAYLVEEKVIVPAGGK